MSKIFRLHTNGASTYEDWNSSPAFPYNSANRATIKDPDGATAEHEITSIPSPFARIDLVKTAFKEVCAPIGREGRPDLDGTSIFHKMVSDTLDVAEIFFNIDNYQGKVEILKWDPSVMLAELQNSGREGHTYLADALCKFMASDSDAYNFGQLRNIYLLNYVSGPDELNIIGATSPATLFFSNANDHSRYVRDIYFNTDRPFDDEYQPLYKRDFEFVKYLFVLRKSIPDFAGLFPELDAYLSETFKAIIDPRKKDELNNVSAASLAEYGKIEVRDSQQSDIAEVLGFPLHKKASRPASASSDFVIKSQLVQEDLPLVLPVDAGNRYSNLVYTSGKWGTTNRAPYYDSEADLSKRKLPFDGGAHPYLTISDFLEDTIIKVPHTLNAEHYFNGHIKIDRQGLAYLLPVKPLFFKYFTADDLRGTMNDGREMVVMTMLSGESVRIDLRIPIKGAGNVSYIEYSRIYYNNNSADIEHNAGNIFELKFTGFIMPPVRFTDAEQAIYNVGCIKSSQHRINFEFYDGSARIIPNSKTSRIDEGIDTARADSYIIKGHNFDYIQVRGNSAQGIIMPIFVPQRGTEVFEFAIDLGTSNTHIEYRKGRGIPQVFSYTQSERMLSEMFIPKVNEYGYQEDLKDEGEIVEKDFIPLEIGNGDYGFPTRTVLSCAKTIDWSTTADPFSLFNLPFTYDKRRDLHYNNLKYNIKWGKADDEVMDAYVRTLMLIIRNKVLINNGDLSRTKITWFYPISMSHSRMSKMSTTWDRAYREYFDSGSGTTYRMTESDAPIKYCFRRYATATSLVNVDIGGGTTDIAFASNGVISNVTSFRFASNAIFENAFSSQDVSNGIIDNYKGRFLKLLQEKELHDLEAVFDSENNAHPANMASFLFGLSENSLVKSKKISAKSIDFNYLLQEDEDFKVVFLVFYTSIIYHIAQLTKALGLEVPRHIAFSGNGSKVIRILSSDSKALAKYTKIIFEKIINRPYDRDLELLGLESDSNPKASTCKGALVDADGEVFDGEIIVLKSDGSGLVGEDDKYSTITDGYKQNAVKAVKDFFNFLFEDMPSAFNFKNYFGISPASIIIAKKAAFKDLATYLDKGIALRREEAQGDSKIEETFFFYPIMGAMHTIAAEIFNSLENQRGDTSVNSKNPY